MTQFPMEYFQPELKEPLDYNEYLPNFINAYICAAISKLCYKEAVEAKHTDDQYKNGVKETLMSWGWTEEDAGKTIFLNSREIPKEANNKHYRPGTQGLVIFYNKDGKDVVFISFRGSEMKLNDWFSNFNIRKVTSPFITESEHRSLWEIFKKDIINPLDMPEEKAKVHRGFLKAFQSLIPTQGGEYETFEEIIRQIKGKDIWLTGHSLGGALASVAAGYLMYLDIPIAGLYTFGAPRIGNRSHRNYMNQKLTYKCWRFANNHDPVADVPLPGVSPIVNVLVTGFSREGCMVRLKDEEEKGYMVLRRIQENGQLERYSSFNGFNAKDHSMTKYIQGIRQIVINQYIENFPEMKYLGIPEGVNLNTSEEDLERMGSQLKPQSDQSPV
jgi:hypothetical protein